MILDPLVHRLRVGASGVPTRPCQPKCDDARPSRWQRMAPRPAPSTAARSRGDAARTITALGLTLCTALPFATTAIGAAHASPTHPHGAPVEAEPVDRLDRTQTGLSVPDDPQDAAFERIDDLRMRAQAFLERALAEARSHDARQESVSFAVQTPDTRLRLARCEDEPVAGFGPGSGLTAVHTTVEIRCQRPAWRVYLGARIERSAMVAIANRHLPRHHIITAGDLRFERRTLGTQNWITEADPVVGQATRRPIRAGQPLAAHLVTSPTHVRRGDRVFIVSQNPRIQIQMMGEALEDGRAGDTIRVRNLSSSREISARVREDGRVEVLL